MTTQPACVCGGCTCGGVVPINQRTYLTFEQAAEYSTLSARTLREYVAAEVLPAIKTGPVGGFGGRRVIRRSDLDAFLKARITDSNVRRLQRHRRTA